ncbi:hypothetical protein KKD70_02115 [Patescibacteria group bacterium]|nr:hypothetical protein [Patescibacteria group bacterium]
MDTYSNSHVGLQNGFLIRQQTTFKGNPEGPLAHQSEFYQDSDETLKQEFATIKTICEITANQARLLIDKGLSPEDYKKLKYTIFDTSLSQIAESFDYLAEGIGSGDLEKAISYRKRYIRTFEPIAEKINEIHSSLS